MIVIIVVDHIRTVHERELPLLEDVSQLDVFRVDELHGFQLGFVAYPVGWSISTSAMSR